MENSDNKIYTVEEIASKLQLNEITIRRYLRSGKLVGVKLGKVWRITEDQLNDFLNENSTKK